MTPEEQEEFDQIKVEAQPFVDVYSGGQIEHTTERAEAALDKVTSLVALLYIKGVLSDRDMHEFGVYL